MQSENFIKHLLNLLIIIIFGCFLSISIAITAKVVGYFLQQILKVICKQMSFDCIICYQKCKSPISCCRCEKLMCRSHSNKLDSKCPNCRLQPFEFQQEPEISKKIEEQIHKERQQMKKSKLFKCLGENCDFQGFYTEMVSHHKQYHQQDKLESLLFEEQRKQKNKRIVLKNLLLNHIQKGNNHGKNYQKAFFYFNKTQGKCQMGDLIKLIQHLEVCLCTQCKKIVLNDHMVYIADSEERQSNCMNAKPLFINY